MAGKCEHGLTTKECLVCASPKYGPGAGDLRRQILAQLDKCTATAYAAGSHFAQHGVHAPSSIMAQADADAALIRLVEQYAAAGVPASDHQGDSK